jgi:hypothetical protein
MPMKYSLIFAGSQILGCVIVAGFGEPIKRNRRLRGKGSGPGNDEFFRRSVKLENRGRGVIIRASKISEAFGVRELGTALVVP